MAWMGVSLSPSWHFNRRDRLAATTHFPNGSASWRCRRTLTVAVTQSITYSQLPRNDLRLIPPNPKKPRRFPQEGCGGVCVVRSGEEADVGGFAYLVGGGFLCLTVAAGVAAENAQPILVRAAVGVSDGFDVDPGTACMSRTDVGLTGGRKTDSHRPAPLTPSERQGHWPGPGSVVDSQGLEPE